jgi:mannose-6-phosphate isomerase-like protein (cupin superfamily)
MKFTIDEYLSQLPLRADEKWTEGVWDIEAFSRKGVKLVFFAPKGKDHQTTHAEDEFYFISRGTGEIVVDGERTPCEEGDAFYVPANVQHRFENFSQDFATWAVFF